MPKLTVDLYQSLYDALHAQSGQTGEPVAHFVTRALSDALGLDHATLFQVSTTGALVQGVYRGAMTLGTLKEHGDFGLGTFDGLDGEMVAFDGEFYQVHASGKIEKPPDNALIPFAVVTRFRPSTRAALPAFHSLADLTSCARWIAALRQSFLRRADGWQLCPHAHPGRLQGRRGRFACHATSHQAEFTINNVQQELSLGSGRRLMRAVSM